jgi:diguanylate cyclase (GGDEF)-like protein/PAS domain S-box-containing protein
MMPMKITLDFYKNLLDNLHDGVYIVNRNREIVYWNKGAERLTGYAGHDVIGSHCWDNILMHVDDQGNQLCLTGCPLVKVMSSGSPEMAEVFLSHKDGHRVPVQVRATPFINGKGKIVGAVEIFSDNTSKITAMQQVQELQAKVFLDPLTGLANRRYVEMNLQGKYDEMLRYGWLFGVVMMDIDNFKDLNDRYGHDCGDEALKVIARTLIHSSRSIDIVGRWGGDEFIAVISNTNAMKIQATAERYRSMVEHSGLPLDGAMLRLSVSAGATVAIPGESLKTVIKRADSLLYASKAAGRNRVTAR